MSWHFYLLLQTPQPTLPLTFLLRSLKITSLDQGLVHTHTAIPKSTMITSIG